MEKTGIDNGEIREKQFLCENKGKLNQSAVGWCRKPLIDPNIKGHFFRKKRWNYYCIVSDDIIFSATIADIDYAASAFVYYYVIETGEYEELTSILPFPFNRNGKKLTLGDSPFSKCFFKNGHMFIDFCQEGNELKIHVNIKSQSKKNISANIRITERTNESLGVVVPWNSRRFQYTSKHIGLPAWGEIEIGKDAYKLGEKSMATLDYGRGLWPYKSDWNWGSFSFQEEEHTFGVNLGAKWTDQAPYNENAFFEKGKLEKINETVDFSYDDKNFENDWIIKTRNSDKIDLVFRPFFRRISKTDLIIIKTIVYQMFGYYMGTVKTEHGIKE